MGQLCGRRGNRSFSLAIEMKVWRGGPLGRSDRILSTRCGGKGRATSVVIPHPSRARMGHPKAVGKCAGLFFDGGADDAAVFGPTAVVVLHVGKAKQILEHDPRVA